MIRPIQPQEIGALADLQLTALPGSLPNRLGCSFLETYYKALLPDPDFYCDGCFLDDRLVGFFAYAADMPGAYSRALRRNFLAFGMAVARSLLAQPTRLGLVFRIARQQVTGGSASSDEAVAELLSFAVLPDHRGPQPEGGGPSIAQQLMDRAFAVLGARGVDRIQVLTKLEGEDPRINRFFHKNGFRRVATVTRFGEQANLHVWPDPSRTACSQG